MNETPQSPPAKPLNPNTLQQYLLVLDAAVAISRARADMKTAIRPYIPDGHPILKPR